jgi:hypothetical protein
MEALGQEGLELEQETPQLQEQQLPHQQLEVLQPRYGEHAKFLEQVTALFEVLKTLVPLTTVNSRRVYIVPETVFQQCHCWHGTEVCPQALFPLGVTDVPVAGLTAAFFNSDITR